MVQRGNKRQQGPDIFPYAVLLSVCLVALVAMVATMRYQDTPATMPTKNAVGQGFLNPTGSTEVCGRRVFLDGPNGHKELYSEDTATNIITKISLPLPSQGQVLSFKITPDGRNVVYRAVTPASNLMSITNLFVVPITGGTSRQLNAQLPDGSQVGNAIISPNSQYVAYTADPTYTTGNVHNFELFIVPITGGTPTQLSPHKTFDYDVFNMLFSPDGQRVVYTAGTTVHATSELFSVPITGGRAVRISQADEAPDFASVAITQVWNVPGPVVKVSCNSQTVYYYAHTQTGGDSHSAPYSVPMNGGQITSLPGTQIPVFDCPVAPPTCTATPPTCQALDTACTSDANCCSSVCSFGACADARPQCETDAWCASNERCDSGTCVPVTIANAQFSAETSTCTRGFGRFFCGAPVSYTSDGIGYVQLWREGGSQYQCVPAGTSATRNLIATQQARTYALYAATDCEPESADKRVALDTIIVGDDSVTFPDPTSDDQGLPPPPPPPTTCENGQHLNENGACMPDTTNNPNPPRIFIDDRDTPGQHELYAEDTTTGVITKISGPMQPQGDIFPTRGFALSANGQYVVYKADAETEQLFELYTVPIEGGQVAKITGEMPGPVGAIFPQGGVLEFAITKDSQRVVYNARAPTPGKLELYTVPIMGGEIIKLNEPIPEDNDAIGFFLSPDSRQVAYTANLAMQGPYELYIVPITGGTVRKLSKPLLTNYVVADGEFTPDSQRIIYMTDYTLGGLLELYSVPAAGGTAVKISQTDLYASGRTVKNNGEKPYAISCDGARVYFIVTPINGGPETIYSVPTVGGTITQLSGTQLPLLDCNA